MILSHHSRFTCQCNTEEIIDDYDHDDDDDMMVQGLEPRVQGYGLREEREKEARERGEKQQVTSPLKER